MRGDEEVHVFASAQAKESWRLEVVVSVKYSDGSVTWLEHGVVRVWCA